jgi:hypothetical protein
MCIRRHAAEIAASADFIHQSRLGRFVPRHIGQLSMIGPSDALDFGLTILVSNRRWRPPPTASHRVTGVIVT